MLHYSVFCNEIPMQEANINGAIFKYRHYINIDANATVVLLVGGLGLSDLFYTHFVQFSQNFSVITFDYSENYKTNDELCKAIASLLTKLNIRAWFVGQSFGGFVAQLVASKYPNVVAGLALSNTGCTSEHLSDRAKSSLLEMIETTQKNKKLLKYMPLSVFKQLIKTKINKLYAKGFSDREKARLKNVFSIMDKCLTKSHEFHMIDLLQDLQNHFGMKQSSFQFLNDKVLLILSDDDNTFHKEVEDALVNLMPSPTVITDLKGGHLSLLINSKKYVKTITDYILIRTPSK